MCPLEASMSRLFVVGVIGFLAAGCGSPAVTAPTPRATPSVVAAPPAPAAVPGAWNITMQTLSDSGPSFCINQPTVGLTFHATYGLVFGGEAVEFVPPNPIDWDSFTAKISGVNFAGSNAPVAFGPYNGMCATYAQSSSISGIFSSDRTSFTATVTWSFRLDSGQTETLTFAWSGTKQQ